ncbi:hypothetical protein A3I18_01205 [Candidatus Campbellbacteria bacterium RIFCSPLOWO2_02_FULL_35_11]|uniref:Uncharacterized protein n=2 Tax=Candidatus Campbelliibacteriota TaxID=1752727 RepID=A0A1F5EPM6_9BACT|nr:MAG: hypothetical protein A3E89_01630 [Candidatus Campbellbacteria bacterium RIFCSPHIGHO2_12_FULL_35_10]OGD70840.1 MAG: hypothetical protein A3I18_01205 [Candidatus Campbellbacteria bacterium RIFCSPLOWO2_02_FULL_35_11]
MATYRDKYPNAPADQEIIIEVVCDCGKVIDELCETGFIRGVEHNQKCDDCLKKQNKQKK